MAHASSSDRISVSSEDRDPIQIHVHVPGMRLPAAESFRKHTETESERFAKFDANAADLATRTRPLVLDETQGFRRGRRAVAGWEGPARQWWHSAPRPERLRSTQWVNQGRTVQRDAAARGLVD